VRDQLKVPGCEILARVDYASYRPDGTVESSDSRLFITSIDPDTVTPAGLLQTIRDHWQVENCLHWQKDRYWEEDKHYLKWSGKIYTGLTNLALSLLQLMKGDGASIRETAEDVHYEPARVLEKLGFLKE
jgi:hypothetical protein